MREWLTSPGCDQYIVEEEEEESETRAWAHVGCSRPISGCLSSTYHTAAQLRPPSSLLAKPRRRLLGSLLLVLGVGEHVVGGAIHARGHQQAAVVHLSDLALGPALGEQLAHCPRVAVVV